MSSLLTSVQRLAASGRSICSSSFHGQELKCSQPSTVSISQTQKTRKHGSVTAAAGTNGTAGGGEVRVGKNGKPLLTTSGGHPVSDDNNRYACIFSSWWCPHSSCAVSHSCVEKAANCICNHQTLSGHLHHNYTYQRFQTYIPIFLFLFLSYSFSQVNIFWKNMTYDHICVHCLYIEAHLRFSFSHVTANFIRPLAGIVVPALLLWLQLSYISDTHPCRKMQCNTS